MPGFTCSEHYDKMGIRSSSTAELHFKDVKVPAENLLGLEGQGFKIAMATLDGGRIGIAAQALGIAQGAYEDALEYAREREQFGAPIGVNQGISFKLAEMATKIEAARLLVYKAAEMKENHEPYSVNAAMAKLFASDIALEVVNDALQIFGGSGYLKGMGVERRYRDAKITTIYEGTNEIQKVVIAANILGKLKQAAKKDAKAAVKNEGQKTGGRKQQMIDELTLQASVKKLAHIIQESKVNLNEKEGVDDPIASSKRFLPSDREPKPAKTQIICVSLPKILDLFWQEAARQRRFIISWIWTIMLECPVRSLRGICILQPVFLEANRI